MYKITYMENLFTVKQAAYILRVHPLTIRRYIKERRIKAVKAGGNVRIKESALQDFNRDFAPNPSELHMPIRQKIIGSKEFTLEDPIFRLLGRGAKVNLS